MENQRVMVLGGTSGIGFAVAAAAAARGADVTVVSSSPDRVAKAVAALPGARGATADLTDDTRVRALFDRPLDHLVYTAGEPLALLPLDRTATAADFFTLRFFGALAAVRAAAPHLRENGSITLTTGVAKDRPGAGWSVAASVCGAVEALTRALAVELAPLRVNAVSPGVVRSPLWSNLPEDARERLYADTAATIPVGRVGEVDDIAEAYLYLMTQPFSSGTVLTVDGGTVLV